MAAARQYKTLARLILTVAAAAPLITCSEHSPTQPGNIGGPSFAIVIVSPNPQTGQVGSTLPPLQVTVTNGNGKGKLLGEVVNFVVTGGGGSVFAPTVVTDLTTGIAQEVWTLGPVAGPQSVEARLIDPGTGNPLSVATFTATATVAPAALISAQAGNGQTAVAGSALPIAPAVLVTDRFGNPITGATVTFAVTGGGGSVANSSPATGSNGIASAGPWTLGTQAGANTLTATRAGLTGSPVTFTATGINAAANQLIPATSTVFSGAVGSTIPAATGPAVRVVDRNNNGVSGVAVTFTITGPACPSCSAYPGTSPSAPAKIAGVSTIATLTDANGRASPGDWTLSTLAGANTLQATTVGLAGSPVVFTATGTAGAAALLFKKAGDGQTAAVATAVATPPAIQVTDVYGNPSSSGISVTFAVQSGGGSVGGGPSVTVTTDLTGSVSVSWTLGAIAGSNTLTATGVGHTVTFTATATGPAGLNIVNYRGDGQTGLTGLAVPIAPAVQVTDLSGHPVAGVQVTFSVTAGGGSVSGAAQITDVGGIATVGSWTLGPQPGVNELQAAFNTGVSTGYTIFVATAKPACDAVATINANRFNLALQAGVLPASSPVAGLGFFDGTQVLFGGGLTYGTSAGDLVLGYDVRGVLGSDFATTPICVVQLSPVHRTVAQLSLVPGANGPAGVAVTQESFAFRNAPDDGYVLLRYTFRNTGAAPVTNFFAGMVMDWDILFGGDVSSNLIGFDPTLNVGVATPANTAFPQSFGIVPVAQSAAPSFRGWTNGAGDAPLVSRSGYFDFLSGGIVASQQGPADIRELMGLGPVTLGANQSYVVYFAVVGGGDPTGFSNNVSAARSMAARLGFVAGGGNP